LLRICRCGGALREGSEVTTTDSLVFEQRAVGAFWPVQRNAPGR